MKVNAHIASRSPLTALAAVFALLVALVVTGLSPCRPRPPTSRPLPRRRPPPRPRRTRRPASVTARKHSIAYDKYSLKIDGKREYIWSGEFHPFRLPNPDLWRDMLQKYKANGINTGVLLLQLGAATPRSRAATTSAASATSTGCSTIAEEEGLYVIARPGPYINAEVDSGGYPGWLQNQAGKARTNADDYQAAWEEYFDAINPIIAKHQLTDGGGSVILYQIENEYAGGGRRLHGGAQDGRARRRDRRTPVPQRQGARAALGLRQGRARPLRDRHLPRHLGHRLRVPARRHQLRARTAAASATGRSSGRSSRAAGSSRGAAASTRTTATPTVPTSSGSPTATTSTTTSRCRTSTWRTAARTSAGPPTRTSSTRPTTTTPRSASRASRPTRSRCSSSRATSSTRSRTCVRSTTSPARSSTRTQGARRR